MPRPLPKEPRNRGYVRRMAARLRKRALGNGQQHRADGGVRKRALALTSGAAVGKRASEDQSPKYNNGDANHILD